MKHEENPNSKLECGDIIEFTLKCGRHWGVYAGYGKVVHVVRVKKQGSNFVTISKIDDVASSGQYKKNNYKDSLFYPPYNPDKIATRAMDEIKKQTFRSSREFVEYCRYGTSDSKLWINVVPILIVFVGLSLYRLQILRQVIFVFIYFQPVIICILCGLLFVLLFTCVWTRVPGEVFLRGEKTEQKKETVVVYTVDLKTKEIFSEVIEVQAEEKPKNDLDGKLYQSIILKTHITGDYESRVSEGGKMDLRKRNFESMTNPVQNSAPVIRDATESIHPHHGDHKTQVSVSGEADIHKHLIGCKKFIPVDTFTLKFLPEGHQNKYLYDFFKAKAKLTVRVDVKITSQKRNKFWPNTETPYPFYNMRGQTNLRIGSGVVSGEVIKFKDQCHGNNVNHCWCKQCQHSETASHVWWEFYVYTATHVVFDDVEASHTSLRLFYDREDSPVVSVDQVRIDQISIETDRCVLKCVTCNKSLRDKLYKIWKMFEECEKVWSTFKKSRDMDLVNFIVSHPHGCSKQVSVGHWKDKY